MPHRAEMPPGQPPAPRSWPISVLLLIFFFAQAVPYFGLVAFDAYQQALRERAERDDTIQDAAAAISRGIDIRLEGYIETLKALAGLPALQSPDLEYAYHQIRAAADRSSSFLFLREVGGRQLFNTRYDYDERQSLPDRKTVLPEDFRQVEYYVSEIADRPGIGDHVIEISVPVRGGERALSLSVEVSVFRHLLAELQDQQLGRVKETLSIDRMEVALTDQNRGLVAGSTSDHESLVTMSDMPTRANWAVTVAVPEVMIGKRLEVALPWYMGAVVLATLAAVGFSFGAARMIARPVAALARVAGAIGDRDEPQFAASRVREVNLVLSTLIAVDRRIRNHEQELAHRLRNQVRVVHEIVLQIAEAKQPPADFERFKAAFTYRLQALECSYEALAEQGVGNPTIADLVQVHTRPFVDGPDRLRVDGPALRPTRAFAIELGIALHELASNAIKHGALRMPGGRLKVAWWNYRATDGRSHVLLRWVETGLADVREPDAAKRGLGYSILTEHLVDSCAARLEFRPEGVVWELDAPIWMFVET